MYSKYLYIYIYIYMYVYICVHVPFAENVHLPAVVAKDVAKHGYTTPTAIQVCGHIYMYIYIHI